MVWGDPLDLGVLALAVLLDLAFGEPHYRVHPTVWIGWTVGWADRLAPRTRVAGTVAGLITALVIPAFWAAAAYLVVAELDWIYKADYFIPAGLHELHQAAYLVVGVVLLKTTFSMKMLQQVAVQVRSALVAGDMAQVRELMSSLVSRDPSQLSAEQATAATVESVSENMSDSFIGPWLAFALFGLPGAFAYRAINTLDSMIGYHGDYEYLGKASARLDDLINLVPSRVTGLFLVFGGLVLPGQTAPGAWRIMLRDHGRTESPNAGWSMSSMAGALGVELEKVGHYRLGDATRTLEPADITRTIQSMYLVAGLGLLMALAVVFLRTLTF